MNIKVAMGIRISMFKEVITILEKNAAPVKCKSDILDELMNAFDKRDDDTIARIYKEYHHGGSKYNAARKNICKALSDFADAHDVCNLESVPIQSIQAFIYAVVTDDSVSFADQIWAEVQEAIDSLMNSLTDEEEESEE